MTRKILWVAILLPFLLAVALLITGNGFFLNALTRTYLQGHTTANINDGDAFDQAVIKTATPQILPKHANYNRQPLPEPLRTELEKYATAAFVVLQNGQIVHETYMNGYHDRSKTNSFSMAKTVTALLVGIAIEEGYIDSFDQPITDFLPEFADDSLAQGATIAHLALMNSGYEWTEHYYSWFSPTVELYHGSDVETFVTSGEFSASPGSFWEYSSASTQLMGVVLKRALNKAGRNIGIAQYLSEKLWQPMGMNDDASWHTDSQNMELVFCCLNTNARNFAKLGQLMLQNGQWNGVQLVPQSHLNRMVQPDGQDNYGYSTWLAYDNTPPFYYFSGHLGQSISVLPEQDMVIVRLGEKRDESMIFGSEEVALYIEHVLNMLK